jgi:hypothetical protein
MDELGVAFDSYGAMGQLVTLVNDVPASPAGELTGTDVDGPFEDLADLSSRLSESQDVRRCVAKKMITYTLGRLIKEDTADACATELVASNVEQSGDQLAEVFRELVKTPIFANRVVGGM